MSGKGQMLDEIPLGIRQNHVQKVSFCGERLQDFNFVDFGEPGSSVGELFGPSKEGDRSRRSPGMGEGSPGQAYKS